jgi:hypothetical protein
MLKAKTIVPNQYWILRDSDRKIGNIEANSSGYAINYVDGKTMQFEDLKILQQRLDVDFESVPRVATKTTTNQVHGYPTNRRPYNPMFDVKHQLPLWTSEPRSRSWLAAGWYRVSRNGRDWKIVQCPKLIMLERYPYQGPFHTADAARKA